jgi:predicted glycosyltransferase
VPPDADVLIAGDAHGAAGLGHLVRSTAVASALREYGIEVRCRSLGGAAPQAMDGVRWTPAGTLAEALR